jgi:carnitine O-acetyltransferase
MSTTATKGNPLPKSSRTTTWAHQCHLPKLPIPPLEDTCRRYLTALKGLQDKGEHENTVKAVEAFLHAGDGLRVQEMLLEYSKDKSRCVRVGYNP